jgi:hypothetical protein
LLPDRTWVDSVGVRKRKMSCVEGGEVESEEECGVDAEVGCCVGDENDGERRKNLTKGMVGGEAEVNCPAMNVRKRRVKKRAVTKTHCHEA